MKKKKKKILVRFIAILLSIRASISLYDEFVKSIDTTVSEKNFKFYQKELTAFVEKAGYSLELDITSTNLSELYVIDLDEENHISIWLYVDNDREYYCASFRGSRDVNTEEKFKEYMSFYIETINQISAKSISKDSCQKLISEVENREGNENRETHDMDFWSHDSISYSQEVDENTALKEKGFYLDLNGRTLEKNNK